MFKVEGGWGSTMLIVSSYTLGHTQFYAAVYLGSCWTWCKPRWIKLCSQQQSNPCLHLQGQAHWNATFLKSREDQDWEGVRMQQELEQFTYCKFYWFISFVQENVSRSCLGSTVKFWSEEAEHTEPGVRIWMRENSISGVSCTGNPLGSNAPCRVREVAGGAGRIWRQDILRAPCMKAAAPLRRNVYYNITEMAQNLRSSVMEVQNQPTRGWGDDLCLSTCRRDNLTSNCVHKHGKQNIRQSSKKLGTFESSTF